jgi:HSP20 family molecular chaperone IbpA
LDEQRCPEELTMPPRDLAAWMWAEACEALTRAEHLQRQFFRLGASDHQPVWEPPIDIFETAAELWIVAALPGVAAARIEITVDSGILVIAGERPPLAAQRAAAIHRLELPQGRFERRIALPAGHFEVAGRTIADGCLTLVLRKLG